MRYLRMQDVFLLLMLATGNPVTAEALKIGVEDAWYPYSGLVDKQIQGFAVDLVQAAFSAGDQEVELVPLPYARCMNDTRSGKLAGCFNTSRDRSLEKDYRFHARPLYSASIIIFVRNDDPLSKAGIDDLKHQTVAVTNGYTYSDEFDNDRSIKRSTVPRDESALRQLAAGLVRFALIFDRVSDHLLSTSARDIAPRVRPAGSLRTMDLYTSFSRQHPAADSLVEKIDRGLERIRRNGKYAQIEQRWKAPGK